MPRAYLRALDGHCYQIDTSDPETLSRWLLETLPKVLPGHPAYDRAEISLHALWRVEDGKEVADWPPDRRVDVLRPEDGKRLYDFIDELHRDWARKDNEARKAERSERGRV